MGGVFLGQSQQRPIPVMNMPLGGPGVGGGTRNIALTIVIRRDATVLRRAFELGGDLLQLLSGDVTRIGHACSQPFTSFGSTSSHLRNS